MAKKKGRQKNQSPYRLQGNQDGSVTRRNQKNPKRLYGMNCIPHQLPTDAEGELAVSQVASQVISDTKNHGYSSKVVGKYSNLFYHGTERDLTGAGKLVQAHPVGTTFKSKDGTVYEVAMDSYNQTKTRFLDWLIDYGAKCRETLLHYNDHPDATTTFVKDSEVVEVPFKNLCEEERNRIQFKNLYWTSLSDRLSEPGKYKRLRLDAEQASQFATMTTGPDKNMQSILHAPFPSFYMEFTDPITIGEQEKRDDGSLRHDEILALIYDENVLTPNPECDGAISFLLRETSTQEISYLSFVLNLAKCIAITPLDIATSHPYDPSVVSESFPEDLIDGKGERLLIAQKFNTEGRYAGYWERAIAKYAEFFSWIILYTVAKGIEIVEEPLPRSERRRMARSAKKGELPEPWQIVRVEPTVVRKYEGRQASSPDKATHGYRYDVRGHLRKGKHKLRDGSYRYTVEWVPAHQRGLKHELYIPKVHQYAGEMDDKFIPEED